MTKYQMHHLLFLPVLVLLEGPLLAPLLDPSTSTLHCCLLTQKSSSESIVNEISK